MSAKGYIISLSLAGTVAALSCWLLQEGDAPAASSAVPAVKTAQKRAVTRDSAPQSGSRTVAAAKPAVAKATPAPSATASRPLTTEELIERAARVEQEANHELRRLVTLLNLDEDQQDRIFQTLAEHSPSWTPGMQFAPAGAASTSGKRSQALSSPGYAAIPGVESPVTEKPAASLAPVTKEPAVSTDATDEIMALLNPDQQNTLLTEEMDRTAWWAEVLEQITPPDDVPSIIPGTPPGGQGEVKAYEGSDTLE